MKKTTTSDGIPLTAWDRVHALALLHSNSTMAGQMQAAESARRRMLSLLRRLEARFGERASILATRSDYVASRHLQERLLLRGYSLAKRTRDVKNVVLIASSLASYYKDSPEKLGELDRWVAELGKALQTYSDPGELRNYKALQTMLARRHSKGRMVIR